jgi:hypothetical protein
MIFLLIITILIIVILSVIIIKTKKSEKYIPSFSPSFYPSSMPVQKTQPAQNELNKPLIPSFINTSQPYLTFSPLTKSPNNVFPSSPTLKGPSYNLQTPYPNYPNINNIEGLWNFNSNLNDYGIVNISYNKSRKIWNIQQINKLKNKKSLPQNIYIQIENQKFILKIDSIKQKFILNWKDNNLISSMPLTSSKETYIFKRI